MLLKISQSCLLFSALTISLLAFVAVDNEDLIKPLLIICSITSIVGIISSLLSKEKTMSDYEKME